MSGGKAPAGLTVRVRNIRFPLAAERQPRWWLDNEPVGTAFFNALSCGFPAGEQFFIDAVRPFADVVEGELREQIREFIGQEAVHGREHAAFNELVRAGGYDIEALEIAAHRAFARVRRQSAVKQLGATAALEHITAIMAHKLLANEGRDLVHAPADIARLWVWHAMEEIEHKAVAFDTFAFAARSLRPSSRYLLRCYALILSTILLFYRIFSNMGAFYRHDGINSPKTWLRTLRYLFWKPGALRGLSRSYAAFFRPTFHPWDIDDSHLLRWAEANYRPGDADDA